MLVKAVIIALLLVVICLAHEQFNWLAVHKNNKYNNWEKMKQYVYIDDECHTDKYFDNFSMKVEEGEMIAVTGKSGCGKSTLLNIIGLLEKVDKGQVCIDGISNITPQGMIATRLIREEIGYLFQNFALVDEESVNYNLKLALKYVKGNKMHIIENALEEVGLSGYGNKKIYQLSGGEQQRVALARIIVKPSKIILADEPTGSLDEQNRDIVLNMLRKMQQQGKTIVIVTHDNYIADKCDRVISLEYQN